jgi:hypothetical protein
LPLAGSPSPRDTKAAVPLDGWTLEMVVKAKRSDAVPLATLSTTNGKLVLDPGTPGRFIIQMTATDTNAIGAGDRPFAIYRTDGGQRTTIMSGTLVVREGV